MLPDPSAPDPESVRKMFDRLSQRYDVFNRCASLGLDRLWRKELISKVLKEDLKKLTILDIGTGTGDLIADMIKTDKTDAGTISFIGLDISEPMLRKAESKCREGSSSVLLIRGNAKILPIASGSVGAIMSAFTLRNIKSILSEVLEEARRVLVPGGKIFFLEMHVPGGTIMKFLHKVYLNTVLNFMGNALFGKDWSGRYLAETIIKFGSPGQFSEILRRAGFQDIVFTPLNGGMAVVHSATK